jgi:hypothetical protein
MKFKFTLAFLGVLAWANVLSAVYAQDFWAKIYGILDCNFDLTPAQGILLFPVLVFIFIVLTGVCSAIFLTKQIRAKKLFSKSLENLAGLFCLSAFVFYLVIARSYITMCAQIIAAGHTEQAHAKVYQTGQVINGKYVNDAFGLSFVLPSGWGNASWATLERKRMSGGNPLLRERFSSTNMTPRFFEGLETLAAILKFLPDNGIPHNPNMVVNANDKKILEKRGITDLLAFSEGMANLPSPYVVDQPITPTNIGGRRAFKFRYHSQRDGVELKQAIYWFESGDTYFAFVISAFDDLDVSNLTTCVNTVKFAQ